MKTGLIFVNLIFLIMLNSCCFGVKEIKLGNNIYLSEYDNVDRRILLQEKNCAKSGTIIVPMSVTEIAYNSEWIIAKSGRVETSSYWIIKNNYDDLPNSETVIENTIEINDYNLFKSFLIDNNINLKLKSLPLF